MPVGLQLEAARMTEADLMEAKAGESTARVVAEREQRAVAQQLRAAEERNTAAEQKLVAATDRVAGAEGEVEAAKKTQARMELRIGMFAREFGLVSAQQPVHSLPFAASPRC